MARLVNVHARRLEEQIDAALVAVGCRCVMERGRPLGALFTSTPSALRSEEQINGAAPDAALVTLFRRRVERGLPVLARLVHLYADQIDAALAGMT